MDEFAREIAGALKATVKTHGPIAEKDIPSATKRIAHALREAMKRETDRMLKSQPRHWRIEKDRACDFVWNLS